ncbi:peroxiredoxin [Tistrella bauzanensis]|uniref:Peroxiredoxin n=1 Tax=Tistrella bauzanensis TaxID=657419 RepID=A0ABQ1J0Y5_9PROT|nr:OsmC family protein [Tistrella bauzanensis]GGB55268.1 peroxiredoxin [Tistrella bauzanensis]
MTGRVHHYAATVAWTGDLGQGTAGYRSFSRDHDIRMDGKPAIAGSSDPAFRGDATRHNPEDLLVGSAAACHMLWYLHLASQAGVIVRGYTDDATGEMTETADGGGAFSRIVLRPRVEISAGDPGLARTLHVRAHELCFIANSLRCPIEVEAEVVVVPQGVGDV